MKTYSTIVVIDSLLKSTDIESTIEKIQRSIKNNGGEILEIDKWGKKRLAYEIKKRQYGYYVEIIFKSSGDLVKVIEREYGLDENILRYLTIVLNSKALQYREKQKKDVEERKKSNEVAKEADAKDNSEQTQEEKQKSKERVDEKESEVEVKEEKENEPELNEEESAVNEKEID